MTLLRRLIENILIFSDIYIVYMEIVLFPIGNDNGSPVSHLMYSPFSVLKRSLDI